MSKNIKNIKEQEKNENVNTTSDNDLEVNENNNKLEDVNELEGKNRLSIHDFTGNGKDIFTTYKSKYENTMSSAIILLFFGIVGIISTILFITGTIKVALSTFQYIFLGIIYIMFLVYGIISYIKALEYKSLIGDENSHEENISAFLKENITNELLDSFHDDNISEEENYVIYIAKIADMLQEVYPDYDKSLIEYHIDEYLNENF